MKKQRKTKQALAFLLSLVMCLSLLPGAALAAEGEAESVQIGIYTTTDMHGRVYDQNPVGGTWKNSYLKVASAMAEERAAMGGTILIDNGDLLQGSTIMSHNINLEAGENNPAALCLRYCGYDAFVPGNHEFNFSLDVQNKFYDLLTSTDETLPGKAVPAVCANLLDETTEEVAKPYVPYVIKEFTVGEKTFKIGVLGFENMNVPNWDLPSHYEGMIFGHKANEEQSFAYEWTNYWQAKLRDEEKCDIVIVAAHSGEGSASDYNKENQLAHLVANTTGIDMVIAGHNHTVGTSTMSNKDGKSVPCVNGGSSSLTKTVLTLNADGTFAFGESSIIDLGAYADDAALKELIKPAYEKASAFVNESIGTLAGTWDQVNTYHSVQGDSYDLVHKAQLWAAKADVSITTPVPKRNVDGIEGSFKLANLFKDGAETASISLKDCYNLYQYDNNLLYGIEMTGKQLKAWLERGAENYTVDAEGKISGGGFGTDIAYGINYDVYLGEEAGSRIQNMTLADGTAVTDDMKLKVALSSYRLSAGEGNDAYGWWATTGITSTSDEVYYDASTSPEFGAIGGSVPLIVGEYIKEMCKDGKAIEPGSATHWTIHAGKSGETAEAEKPADTELETALAWAKETKLLTEDEAAAFAPEKSCTRAQMLTYLWRAAGSPAAAADSENTFADVAADAEYYQAVLWAVEAGITSGTSDAAFSPEAPVTRAQAVTFLYRLANAPAAAEGVSFADVAAEAYYAPAVNWAVEKGIASGVSETVFGVKDQCTCAQVMIFMFRSANTAAEAK